MGFVLLLLYITIAVLFFVGLVMLIRYACSKMGLEPIVQTIAMIVVAMLFLVFIVYAFQSGMLRIPRGGM